MALEIEHKYLVINEEYKSCATSVKHIFQGYLNRTPDRTVRIRICNNQAFITVKGRTTNGTRLEFEYEIPLADGQQMLRMCEGTIIEKFRYIVPYCGQTWEVDEFKGGHSGLVIAEIELSSTTLEYQLPPFVGENVTSNPSYYNSNL